VVQNCTVLGSLGLRCTSAKASGTGGAHGLRAECAHLTVSRATWRGLCQLVSRIVHRPSLMCTRYAREADAAHGVPAPTKTSAAPS
jgi:hypothetical protein